MLRVVTQPSGVGWGGFVDCKAQQGLRKATQVCLGLAGEVFLSWVSRADGSVFAGLTCSVPCPWVTLCDVTKTVFASDSSFSCSAAEAAMFSRNPKSS